MMPNIKGLFLQYGKNLSLYFLASLIPMLLNLVTNPFIAKNMSPRDYAIVGYFSSFSSLITPLILFYMTQYYIRNYFNVSSNEERDKLKAIVIKALLSFSVLLSVICYIAITSYINIYNPGIDFPVSPYLLLMVLPITLSGIFSLQTADYKMAKNAKSFFVVTVLFGIINVFVNLLFVVILELGAFGKMLAPILVYLAFSLWVLYKNRDIIKLSTTLKDFKDIFVFCWPLAGGAMLGYFTAGYDKTVLETLHNTDELGIYVVGAQMAGYLAVFATSISDTFQPDVYEAILKNQNKKLYKTYLLQISMIVCVVLAFIIVCPYIIDILTAGRYTISSGYARIISLSTIASTIYYNINGYAIGKGFPKLYLEASLIGGIIIFFVMPFVVTHYQYYGAAWMNTLSFMIISCIYVLLLYGKKVGANEK